MRTGSGSLPDPGRTRCDEKSGSQQQGRPCSCGRAIDDAVGPEQPDADQPDPTSRSQLPGPGKQEAHGSAPINSPSTTPTAGSSARMVAVARAPANAACIRSKTFAARRYHAEQRSSGLTAPIRVRPPTARIRRAVPNRPAPLGRRGGADSGPHVGTQPRASCDQAQFLAHLPADSAPAMVKARNGCAPTRSSPITTVSALAIARTSARRRRPASRRRRRTVKPPRRRRARWTP